MSSMNNHLKLHGPWDPWKAFFTFLGAKNASDLCRGLSSFYIDDLIENDVCPDGNLLFPKQSCIDFVSLYQEKCNVKKQNVITNTTLILIIFGLITALFFAHLLKRCRIITETGIYIFCGVIFGLFLYGEGSGANATFDPSLFFLILIPHIVLSNGLTMDTHSMWRYMNVIFVFSIIGTILFTLITAILTYYFCQLFGFDLSPVSCGLFAAIISSLDPSATRTALMETGLIKRTEVEIGFEDDDDNKIDAVIQGEAVFNDVVSVALFYSLLSYIDTSFSINDTNVIFGRLIWVWMGSLGIGFLSAIFSALFFKYITFLDPTMEVVVFLGWALTPYYLCNALEMSGVVAVTVETLAMSFYTLKNLSQKAKGNVVFVSQTVGRLMSVSTYIYIGVQLISPLHPSDLAINNVKYSWHYKTVFAALLAVLISRILVVVPLSYLTSLHSFRNTTLLCWSGLRGPVAYALAMTIPRYDQVTQKGSKDAGEILAITTFTILFFTFIFGGIFNLILYVVNGGNNNNNNNDGTNGNNNDDFNNSNNRNTERSLLDTSNVSDYASFVDINNSETSSDVAKVLSAKRSYSGQRIDRNSYCTPIYNCLRRCLTRDQEIQ